MSFDGWPQLREKLDRWSGVARGVIVALLTGSVIVAVDAAYYLGVRPRIGLLISWLSLVFFLSWIAWWRPVRLAPRTQLAAVLLLFVAVFVSLFAPGSADRYRRLFLPWQTAPEDKPFRLLVPSGHATLARGESVTLVGYPQATRRGEPLPEQLTLLLKQDSGETRQEMQRDGQAFWFTVPRVQDDFTYCILAGTERSEWFRVQLSDPVHLKPTTQVRVQPPNYAESQVAARIWPGWTDLEALAGSKLQITLRFDRPVNQVQLNWVPLQGEPQPVSVRLDPDYQAGVASLIVKQSGVLQLQLFGARNLKTENVTTVRVLPDQPPRFEKVVGLSPNIQQARPTDRVMLELAARDDLQLARAWVEYASGEGDANIRTEPLKLTGLGTSRAEGVALFNLAGKVKEGETLRFRLVIADHRQDLSEHLGPQEVRFPVTGWTALRINANSLPIAEQEVAGHRNRLREVLNAAIKPLQEASEGLRKLRTEKVPDGPLSLDQSVKLRSMRNQLLQCQLLLQPLADELALVPDLLRLSRLLQEVFPRCLLDAEQFLKQGEGEPKGPEKEARFKQAAEQLARVEQQLKLLIERNEKLADVRAALRGLRELASDQRDLAEHTAKPEELARQQADLNARLAQLINQQNVLNQSLQEANCEETRQVFDRASTWLKAQHQLNFASQKTLEQYRQQVLSKLVQEQLSLLELATQLRDQTSTAARIAGSSPLSLLPFQQALQMLKLGDATATLSEQEKASQELEKLAQELRRSVAQRSELREAMKQVARWQDDLRRRASDGTPAQLAAFRGEQTLLAKVWLSFMLPTVDLPYSQQFSASYSEVMKCVEKFSPEQLARAAESLNKTAELSPTRTERLKSVKVRLDQLRREQDELRNQTELMASSRVSNPPGELAVRQKALLERFKLLDLPSLEPRRAAVTTLAEMAVKDLNQHFVEDAVASQLLLKKQLDRLKLALDGHPLPEEVLAEIADQQRRFSEQLQKLNRRSPTDLQDLETQQRERTRSLSRIVLGDIPLTLAEIVNLSEGLEASLRLPDTLDAMRQKNRVLVQKLDELIRRLRGEESDLRCVTRLAQERAIEWQASKVIRAANPVLSQEAARRADQQLEELNQVRVGAARTTKKQAVEALQKLKQASDPDRRPILQQVAAEVLKKLQDELANDPERQIPWRAKVQESPSEKQRLEELRGGGQLPNLPSAILLEHLNQSLKAVRDRTANAIGTLNRGVPKSAEKPHEKGLFGLTGFVIQAARIQSRVDLQATLQVQQQEKLLRELQVLTFDLRKLAIHRGGLFNEPLLNLAQELDNTRSNLNTQQLLEVEKLLVELAKKLPARLEDERQVTTGAALATALDSTLEVTQKLAQPNGVQLAREAMQAATDALNRTANRLQLELR